MRIDVLSKSNSDIGASLVRSQISSWNSAFHATHGGHVMLFSENGGREK